MMNNTSKPWKIGICGCGSSTDLYRDIHCHNDVFQLVAVADAHIDRSKAAAQHWGGVKAYSNAKGMLENENLDMMIIATPPDSHSEIALAAIDNGIHLLIQKPLACTVAEGQAIIDGCKSKGCGLKVSFARRYYPAFQKATELIGTLGQGLLLRCTWCSQSGWKNRPEKQWKKSRNTLGGVLVDLGSHVIDLTRWWMGEVTGCRLGMSIVKGELDNMASFILKHDRGGNTVCSLSNVDYTSKEVYEYIGTEGGFILKRTNEGYPGSWKLSLHRHQAASEQWCIEPSVTETNPFIQELTRFISTLQKGQTPVDENNSGSRTLELTSLLYKSSMEKDKMTLDNFELESRF